MPSLHCPVCRAPSHLLSEEPLTTNAVIMSAEDHGMVLSRGWSDSHPWVAWGLVDPMSWDELHRLEFGPFVLLFEGDSPPTTRTGP